MFYECHTIDFKRGALYWLSRVDKKEKTIISLKNEDDKCFRYAVTVALNCGEVESHSERSSNVKPFMNKYNSKGINLPSKIGD